MPRNRKAPGMSAARASAALRLLRKLLARGVRGDRQVQIARRGVAEQPLQMNLPRGRIQQVCAAHHVGHALGGVVHHHGELIGEQAVGAPQRRSRRSPVSRDCDDLALHPVGEADRLVVGAHPHRARGLARRRARRGRCPDRCAIRRSPAPSPRVPCACRRRDSSAPSRLSIALPVKVEPRALVNDGPIPFQAEGFQLPQDRVRRPGHDPRPCQGLPCAPASGRRRGARRASLPAPRAANRNAARRWARVRNGRRKACPV